MQLISTVFLMNVRKKFGCFDNVRNDSIEKKTYFIAHLYFADCLSKTDVPVNKKFN